MGGNTQWFFCLVFILWSFLWLLFGVCLFFFGTGTLALLSKEKWSYIHECNMSYGAKDRNIVRKTVLFQHGMYLSFGLLNRFGTTAHCSVKDV